MAVSRRAVLGGGLLLGVSVAASGSAAAALDSQPAARVPLWQLAARHGLRYGSSTSTWQIADPGYRRLQSSESRLLLTEDDLLWYRVKPKPNAPLDFRRGDAIVKFAADTGQQVLGAHLVWDQGFGRGWTKADLWKMSGAAARRTLFGTVAGIVSHFENSIASWSVVNEAVSGSRHHDRGLRRDTPWYATIGAGYVEQAFETARTHAPRARLLLNDFGFETACRYGADPALKRHHLLQVLDSLAASGVPVDGVGLQAHLDAREFASGFDAVQYGRFLDDLAARDLDIVMTELDVLDDGLPKNPAIRDKGVADVYRRYLDVTLACPRVREVVTFGLSDRYTWLDQAYPRHDGARRRPLPFDGQMQPAAAYQSLRNAFRERGVSACRPT